MKALSCLQPVPPNLNAYAERFVHSLEEECLSRMRFIGQASLRQALCEFMVHYHAERNHQGLESRLISVCPRVGMNNQSIHRRQSLGGMLNFYYRKAA